jgi:ParB family chromosome partitioning protein
MNSINPLPSAPSVVALPVTHIRPGRTQARRRFAQDALEELAASIRASGVIQPVVVRSVDAQGYELLAGERRWRAAQIAGLDRVPAIIRDDLPEAEALVLGLVENLQRESLSAMETAAGLQRLGEAFGLTHEVIGRRIGKSRVYVTNYLRLLGLETAVQSLVDEGAVTLGHAKVIAGVEPKRQLEWALRVVREQLSVRALERRLATGPAATPRISKGADWQRLERALSDQLGYPAEIEADGDGRGQVRVRFASLQELDGLLLRLGLRDSSTGE